MAITVTNLTANGDTTLASSYTTGSFTPAASTLMVAMIGNTKASTPELPTMSGHSVTWTQIATRAFDTAASPTERITAFWAVSSASPASGTCVFDFGGVNQTGGLWLIRAFPGAAITSPIVQSATNQSSSSASPSVTLASFADAVNNLCVGYFMASTGAGDFTVGSGFSTGGAQNISSPTTLVNMEYKTGEDTSVDGTYVGSVPWGGIAIEIAIATAGGVVNKAGLIDAGLVGLDLLMGGGLVR